MRSPSNVHRCHRSSAISLSEWPNIASALVRVALTSYHDIKVCVENLYRQINRGDRGRLSQKNDVFNFHYIKDTTLKMIVIQNCNNYFWIIKYIIWGGRNKANNWRDSIDLLRSWLSVCLSVYARWKSPHVCVCGYNMSNKDNRLIYSPIHHGEHRTTEWIYSPIQYDEHRTRELMYSPIQYDEHRTRELMYSPVQHDEHRTR